LRDPHSFEPGVILWLAPFDATNRRIDNFWVSYYNGDAKRTKGVYRQRIQKARGHTVHRGWARLLLVAPGTSSPTARRTAARTARRCRRTRTIRTATSFSTTPRGGATSPPRRAQPLLLLFRSNPPTDWGGRRKLKTVIRGKADADTTNQTRRGSGPTRGSHSCHGLGAVRCWPLVLDGYGVWGGESAWDSTGDRAQGGFNHLPSVRAGVARSWAGSWQLAADLGC